MPIGRLPVDRPAGSATTGFPLSLNVEVNPPTARKKETGRAVGRAARSRATAVASSIGTLFRSGRNPQLRHHLSIALDAEATECGAIDEEFPGGWGIAFIPTLPARVTETVMRAGLAATESDVRWCLSSIRFSSPCSAPPKASGSATS
jgi:hypothetical protein